MAEPIVGARVPARYSKRDAFRGMKTELKMGSRIIPKCGTYHFTPGVVGPFVKIRGSDNMFFLTANHVINQRMLYSRTIVGSQVLLLLYGTGRTRRCGQVFACGTKGGRAALVRISDDLVPTKESFKKALSIHFAGISPINFPTYDNRDGTNTTNVIVFGKKTRTAAVKIVADNAKERLYLYTDVTGLFEPGEAGTAVFLIDKDRMLHCVGILTGGIEGDIFQFIITPIESILLHLEQKIGHPVDIATFDKPVVSKEATVSVVPTGPSIDNIAWTKCIELKDEEYGLSLLGKNLLPDQEKLDELCQTFGRTSRIVKHACKIICSKIKSLNNKIINVLPTYKPERPNKILFLIILKEEVNIKNERRYRLVKKMIDRENHKYGKEGRHVMYSKQSEETRLSDGEIDQLRKCVNEHGDTLMEQHKLLTAISVSSIRSRGYGTKNARLEKETCILLYVLFKGYIPVEEEPFALSYSDVAVDIREGMFNPFTLPANAYLENLQMGCQIAGIKQGTVGGFLQYPGFGLCGLTCAHLLLDSSGMNELANNPEGTLEWESPTSKHNVYQPDDDTVSESRTEKQHYVGRLVKAIYRKGGGGESGMDVALFQVEKRYPVSGEFPGLKDGRDAGMAYDSGTPVGLSRLKFGRLKKYGATSDITDGTVVMETPILSVKYIDFALINDDRPIVLHNMLEVKTLSVTALGERQPFADFGDSGALVFCEEEDNKLFCVGMIEGGLSADTCVVMPIMPILGKLGVTCFKNFEYENIRREIDILKNEVRILKRRTNRQRIQSIVPFRIEKEIGNKQLRTKARRDTLGILEDFIQDIIQ